LRMQYGDAVSFLLVILVGIVMVNECIHCGFQWMEWYIGRLLKNDTFLFG
jgi:hypothetical protein